MRFGHEPPEPDVNAMVREAREDREEIKTLRARAEKAETERDESRIALARIGALTRSLRCPACSKLHTDDGRTPEEQGWAQRPHRTHLCVDDAAGKGCGATWVQPHADVIAGVELVVSRAEVLRGAVITRLPNGDPDRCTLCNAGTRKLIDQDEYSDRFPLVHVTGCPAAPDEEVPRG